MRFLLMFIFSIPFATKAQDTTFQHIFPMKDGNVYYERIFAVDSSSKEQLYARAKTWALANFRSQKDASQTDDRELGLIAYTSYFSLPFTAPPIMGNSGTSLWQYWHTLKIYLKEGKAKIVIDNIKIGSDAYTYRTNIEDMPGYLSNNRFGSKNFRENYNKRVYDNLRLADMHIKEILYDIEVALKNRKNAESDF